MWICICFTFHVYIKYLHPFQFAPFYVPEAEGAIKRRPLAATASDPCAQRHRAGAGGQMVRRAGPALSANHDPHTALCSRQRRIPEYSRRGRILVFFGISVFFSKKTMNRLVIGSHWLWTITFKSPLRIQK